MKTPSKQLIDKYIEAQDEIRQLPLLSDLEKITLENSIDIEHLYFSSKIEGSNLTKKQIEEAVK